MLNPLAYESPSHQVIRKHEKRERAPTSSAGVRTLRSRSKRAVCRGRTIRRWGAASGPTVLRSEPGPPPRRGDGAVLRSGVPRGRRSQGPSRPRRTQRRYAPPSRPGAAAGPRQWRRGRLECGAVRRARRLCTAGPGRTTGRRLRTGCTTNTLNWELSICRPSRGTSRSAASIVSAVRFSSASHRCV